MTNLFEVMPNASIPRRIAFIAAKEIIRELPDIEPSSDKANIKSKEYIKWVAGQVAGNAHQWPEHKLHRWLGWMQGLMNAMEITTVEQEMERMRRIAQTLDLQKQERMTKAIGFRGDPDGFGAFVDKDDEEEETLV